MEAGVIVAGTEELKGGDVLMADKPNQQKLGQPSGGQTKPNQPQPTSPKK